MAHFICPTCRGKVSYKELKDVPHRPFCSYRCKMVDLGKWLNEEYRISEPLTGEEGPPPQEPPRGSPG